ncbi:uncharacterized protein N7473_001758 [Penicillium subrubescens]|uniref:uncharacterized protein n=1 Tax=Penicillium subrubescens TaxID=1316194 RepID=UPI002545B220|nr:uncharacterized protein N7473_001758 [Penicillium subrubescens]KAJ5904842.1 hypothetical protein N7473_001758 [Penicillium subrubescens]
MVNTGQPSRDCAPCKKRKLRCDLRPGGCSQCHRAKLFCYGYLDPTQLLIHDETGSTQRKVLARQNSPHGLPPVLQLGWVVRARDTFFSLYVFGLSRSYHALAPLYDQATSSGHLSSCVDAVSLAFVSFQCGSPAVLYMARQKYVDGIRKVGQALQDPTTSLSDETLQSVLLLDLYEKMVNRNPHSLPSWTSHIRGAMSLVKARGARNFSSPIACQLSFRLSMTLPISYGLANLLMPKGSMGLMRELDPYITGIKKDFTALAADTFRLKCNIAHGRVSSSEAVQMARGIHSRLVALEAAFPPSWMPRSVICADPRILGVRLDIYPDHFAAQLWNAVRFHRLATDDIIQTNSSGDSCVTKDAFQDIAVVVEQICAMVPQFILPGLWPDNEMPFSPLQRLRCCTILAPLYIAGQLSNDLVIKNWAVQTLESIADIGNLRIAREVATLLASARTDYWLVYAMSGSYAFAA